VQSSLNNTQPVNIIETAVTTILATSMAVDEDVAQVILCLSGVQDGKVHRPKKGAAGVWHYPGTVDFLEESINEILTVTSRGCP